MILLWDSAEMTISCELVDGEQNWRYEWEAGRTLARDMLAFLRDKLAEHDTKFTDISGIGVMRGPGSYTGLRIGLTVLNTIASDRKVPIVGATGDDWREQVLARLQRGENDGIVLPEYDGEAHVTSPSK